MGALLLAQADIAAAAPAPTFVKEWGNFYALSYGTLGIFQNQNLAHPLLQQINPGQLATINVRGDTIVALNHANRLSGGDETPTYVAITVFLVHHGDEAKDKPVLTTFRNPGWYRNGCYYGNCFDKNGTQEVITDPSIFATLRHDWQLNSIQLAEKELDIDLRSPFDGEVTGSDPDLNSWDARNSWPSTKTETVCTGPGTMCEVHFYLLSYTPSSSPSGSNALTFDFESWSTDTAIITTRSPTEAAFNNRYVINYRQ